MSNFQIRTRTWSKLDSNSDHENNRYRSRTRMRIKKRAQTCTKTLATKDTHIMVKVPKSCTNIGHAKLDSQTAIMKIPATVRGHECASRNVHKNTRYKRIRT
ncbi:hypothetical protein MIMGU_mgv11b019550mg [Erythranthe guttata]|uniref:Uncharacterized protein n=1 Tax=Erythranthe guttata TaxID=4155 RepID=A0A022REG9_ERYGU|nr:hypothetical protein MIMGU_mgv11b019550mg [Erythranthe guttata]